METQKNQLVKLTPGFIEDSLMTIDKSMEYANMLLKSKLVPNHFYEKGSDNKPDFTKGKPEAVLVVLQHGMELGLSVSQSLQQVVPVNGLISLKGDAAKALILTSGKCESWEETYDGSVDKGDYSYTINSKRTNGQQSKYTFSLSMAERAGLWYKNPSEIKNEHVRNAYFYSPWRKYTERMVRYRCLGFISRDLYPDVTNGIVTTEEAQDYPPDDTVLIETPAGQKIKIPIEKIKELEEQADRISTSVAGKITDITSNTDEPSETNEESGLAKVYTEDELKDEGIDLIDIAKKMIAPALFTIMKQSVYPKKKTKKYWREAILANQEGKIQQYIQSFSKAEQEDTEENEEEKGKPTAPVQSSKPKPEKPASGQSDLPYDNPDIEKQHQENKDLKPNAEFTSQPSTKISIEIPEVDSTTGKREDTGDVYNIYEALTEPPPKGLQLPESKLKEVFGDKYKDFEEFAERAPKSEIEILLGK